VLAVVGNVARDVVDGGPPRLGGAAWYCARALASLGLPAIVVTKYSAADRRLAAPLHGLGIPVAWRQAASTTAFRIDLGEGERSMTIEDLGEPWTPEEARGWVAEALSGSDWVHVGALTRGHFPAQTLAELRRGRTVCLDGQGLVRPARTGLLELDADFDPEVLRHVDVLKLSGPEAQALGVDPLGGELGNLGVPEVVVTLGREGARVYAEGKVETLGARPVEVADTTGAGDVFVAAYLQGRRGGQAPARSAKAASAFVRSFLTGWQG
jgi:sugar/nucleoside kinase (ribokinase family)